RKLRVVRNDQIQEAIAIVVEPGGTSRPLPRVLHAGIVSDICKGPVAIVVIKSARGIAGGIEVLIAVVVEICRSHAHAIEIQLLETGFGRDIFKFAVAQVSIDRKSTRLNSSHRTISY